MPKIKIQELDNTGSSVLPGVDNTVYIPLKKAASIKITKPTLFTTIKDFMSVTDGCGKTNTGIGWSMAYRLLALGMSVLVDAVEAEGSINFGKDGLRDKSLYDIRFITAGDFAGKSEIYQNMLSCAAARKDCFALLDAPKATTDATLVHNLVQNLGNGEFGAMFAPWCKFTKLSIDGDSATNELPGSFAFLSAYAVSIVSNPVWFATAGALRGTVPNLIEPLVEYGTAAQDILQCRAEELDGDGDNIGVAVNPICYVRPYGYMIYGNRTLRKNDGSTKATSFLNVRNIVCEISKTLYSASRKLTFEQNSDILWATFKGLLTPMLDSMLSGQGITSYNIVKEATDAKARLKARVVITPIEAVEDFELTIVLDNDNRASVSE